MLEHNSGDLFIYQRFVGNSCLLDKSGGQDIIREVQIIILANYFYIFIFEEERNHLVLYQVKFEKNEI